MNTNVSQSQNDGKQLMLTLSALLVVGSMMVFASQAASQNISNLEFQ